MLEALSRSLIAPEGAAAGQVCEWDARRLATGARSHASSLFTLANCLPAMQALQISPGNRGLLPRCSLCPSRWGHRKVYMLVRPVKMPISLGLRVHMRQVYH